MGLTREMTKRPVWSRTVWCRPQQESRKRCSDCGKRLYYNGSVEWHNGDAMHIYACDCLKDEQRRHVEFTTCQPWKVEIS